jgi:hypothetical protein
LQVIHSKLSEAVKKFGEDVVREVQEKIDEEGDWVATHFFRDMEMLEHLECLNFIY